MSQQNDEYLDRKGKLESEGKFELPLNIDTNKYFLGSLAYKDLLIIAPAAIISLLLFLLFRFAFSWYGTPPIIVSLSPALLIGMLQMIKHPIRRNVSLLKFKIIARWKYNNSTKTFFKKRGVIDMSKSSEDTRSQLQISDIFSGGYETVDGHFVKVLEVSSVNLSLMNPSEKRSIISSYKSFINEISFLKSYQIQQIAQPINLTQYLTHVKESALSNENHNKQHFSNSYFNYIDGIQTNRGMVSRKRYLIISEKIGSDRDKSLRELERKVNITRSSIENMLSGYFSLNARILNNEELLNLFYTCLNYDNAQAIGNFVMKRAENASSVSLGEKTAREIVGIYDRSLKEEIQ